MIALGKRWRRILRIGAELALGFGALVLIDHLATGGTAFAAVQPNPYWLPVLIMALAYGTEAGLVAATIASAIWLAHVRNVPAMGDYLDRLLQLSLTPLLWFLVAALVGEVTLLRTRRQRRLANEAAVATRNVARLSDGYRELAATNRALQMRIAVDAGATGRIVALATDLSAPDPALRRNAIGELIAAAAGTSDFTCYRLDRDGGVRVWLRGASAAARPDILPAPLVLTLSSAARVLCVARAEDRAVLADVGVASVPLAHSEGGSIGCLVIHSVAFASLNTQTIAELTEIGSWLPRLIDDGATSASAQAHRLGRA